MLLVLVVASACLSCDDSAFITDGELTVRSESPCEFLEFEDPPGPVGPSGYSGFDIELMNALAGELDRELVVANRILVIGLGLPIALGIRIPTTFGPGALALSLVVGAHMAETLRAGIEAVGRG